MLTEALPMKDGGRLQEISKALFRRLFPCPDDLESVFITCVFIGVFFIVVLLHVAALRIWLICF